MNLHIASLLSSALSALPLAAWWGWHDRGDCWLPFSLLLPVTGFMTLNMLETALMRRRALVGMYLKPESLAARLLCRRFVLVTWQVIKAVMLGLVLFTEAPRWPAWLWLVLGIDLLLLLPLYWRVCIWLESQVRAGRRNIMARRLLLPVNTGLLVLAIAVGQMLAPRPDYSRMDWEATAVHAAGQVGVQCGFIAPVARLAAMRDALAERLIQRMPGNTWIMMGTWLAYFLWSGLVFWAWTRLILGGLGVRDSLDFLEDRRCD